MNLSNLYQRALRFEFLSAEEGAYMFEHAPLSEIAFVANELRKIQVPYNKVTKAISESGACSNM